MKYLLIALTALILSSCIAETGDCTISWEADQYAESGYVEWECDTQW